MQDFLDNPIFPTEVDTLKSSSLNEEDYIIKHQKEVSPKENLSVINLDENAWLAWW